MLGGITNFTIFFSFFSICIMAICVYFKLNAKKQLSVINSKVYRVYYLSRVFFISFAFCACFGYAFMILYIYKFEEWTNNKGEIKEIILKEIQKLPIKIDYILVINNIYSIYVLWALTH